uniref:Gibberellin 3-oxidase n=1 Tax=Phaseolus coccineus TaxID=3886 RepID=Q4A3R2_PHACN|nr:gibberellin 3-oxidase [Phaseolus coccineus]
METLNDAYKAHPLDLGDIIPIDFSSSPAIPDSHSWSEPNDNRISSDDPPPVIDLLDPKAKDLISLACQNSGAFQLTNHGIPLGVIQAAEEEVEHLFSLPTEQKMKALRTPDGATGYGRARISPFFPKGMWHEGFTIIGSISQDVKKIWPDDHARFCDRMEDYEKKMKILAERVTEILFDLLNVSEEKRKWVDAEDKGTAIQLNFYPSCPEPNRTMGLAPHTDTSIITIVQSPSTGLQLYKEEKGWISVQPHPEALIVHLGDLAHIISNGRFCSPLHRVTLSETCKRYSIAYFYSPPIDHVLSPFVTEDDKSAAQFRPVTVKEYIAIKAQHFGNSISFVKI